MSIDRPPSNATPPRKSASGADADFSEPDPLDRAVLELAVQAAFLQGFAENLAEEERPVEEVLPAGVPGEMGFDWRTTQGW